MTREERESELTDLAATFGGSYKLGELYALMMHRSGQEWPEPAKSGPNRPTNLR